MWFLSFLPPTLTSQMLSPLKLIVKQVGKGSFVFNNNSVCMGFYEKWVQWLFSLNLDIVPHPFTFFLILYWFITTPLDALPPPLLPPSRFVSILMVVSKVIMTYVNIFLVELLKKTCMMMCQLQSFSLVVNPLPSKLRLVTL